MKITYTAPNRSHHYPYAEAMHEAGCLHQFICGFSRLSPRAPFPALGDKLRRHDFFQTVMLLSERIGSPVPVVDYLRRRSDLRLDAASYPGARESDFFLFYRTEGFNTMNRLHREGAPTVCVMEEVNSHVESANEILREEFSKLGLDKQYQGDHDYDLRLRTYEEADYILCPSEFVRKSFIQKGFAPEQLIKVNFGFKTFNHQGPANVASSDTFRVLFVGQINFRKGLRYALRAFDKLRHPHKEFVIVGPKTNITGIENEPIPDHVRFTGVLKGEDLMREYSNATVFILPSLEEGLALVQGEALSFGVPLLITTNTGGEDLITDGVEGFVVPPADADQLALKLQHMADDRPMLQEMSANALRATETLGSWESAGRKLITEFSNILARPVTA